MKTQESRTGTAQDLYGKCKFSWGQNISTTLWHLLPLHRGSNLSWCRKEKKGMMYNKPSLHLETPVTVSALLTLGAAAAGSPGILFRFCSRDILNTDHPEYETGKTQQKCSVSAFLQLLSFKIPLNCYQIATNSSLGNFINNISPINDELWEVLSVNLWSS